MTKEGKNIKRENMITSTLFKEIIRIDLFRIREVEEFLVGIDPILKENGFRFKTNEIEGIDFSINDPEALITQRFMRNSGNTISYEYVGKFGEELVINEYMIILQRMEFANQRTVSDNINMLSQIMGKLAEMETISVERIGVREVNRAKGKDLSTMLKIFKFEEVDLDNAQSYENYENSSKKILQDSQRNGVTILKEIVKGMMQIDKQDVELYMTTIDIDVYSRRHEGEVSEKNIRLKLIELADFVFDEFMSYDNEILERILKDPDNLEDLEIY